MLTPWIGDCWIPLKWYQRSKLKQTAAALKGVLTPYLAESVNFVPAARWDDESVGTNALDLANRLDRPSMVFSAEHYAPIVHNWVCWAAPVHDPLTGRQLGVIDLSTTWDRTHPIGLATARVLARLIETAMPLSTMHPLASDTDGPTGLVLRLLGNAEAIASIESAIRKPTPIVMLAPDWMQAFRFGM